MLVHPRNVVSRYAFQIAIVRADEGMHRIGEVTCYVTPDLSWEKGKGLEKKCQDDKCENKIVSAYLTAWHWHCPSHVEQIVLM